MSRLWPMLMLRGSTYYYHRNVPKRIRPLLGGKAQIWKSLRTSSLDVAKLRSLEEGQRVERRFQDLRRQPRRRTPRRSPVCISPGLMPRTLSGDGRTFGWTMVPSSLLAN